MATLMFSNGHSVTVSPPPRRAAKQLARQLQPLKAQLYSDSPAVVREVPREAMTLLAPYIECRPMPGLDKVTHLIALCATSDDWTRLFAAVLVHVAKKGKHK